MAMLLLFATLDAQAQTTAPAMRPLRTPVPVGSPYEELRRIAFLLGAPSFPLIRSASISVIDTTARQTKLRWAWIAPSAELTWNSGIPFSLNDGPQWTGRGLTVTVAGGIQATSGPVTVVLLPQFWRTQNRPFAILPGGDPQRSDFASPFHWNLISADLPIRFGYEPTTALEFGESSVFVSNRMVAAGVSTESLWWGPGIRNALIMSNNAGGFPHLFVNTVKPWTSAAGSVAAQWVVGGLSESRYFDTDGSNDLRSLSGAVVTFTPAIEPDVDVGISRIVYMPIRGVGGLASHAFDVIGRWDGRRNRSASGGPETEQLLSLFGRWRFPNSAAEAYGEWSRILLPASIRDLLVAPQFSQGFTVGLQWVPALSTDLRLRLLAEATNVEQSPSSSRGDTLTYYVSSVVPQGYTHRGQVLGAAIGPGSSSQWVELDVLRRDRSVGVFVGRIRWDTDAYYTQRTSLAHYSYDATVLAGVRALFMARGRLFTAEASLQRRYNFLFQNSEYGYSRDDAFDQRNLMFRLRAY